MLNLPLRLSMKRVAFAFAAMLVWAKPAALHAEDGVIDLAALPNYARQARPSYIFGDNTPVAPGPSPVANRITNTGATHGRLLFYDKRLSRNDTVSCSSCHHHDQAFRDPVTASTLLAG